MSMRLTAIITVLCSLALTACGPIYRTSYEYQLPQSEMGRMCNVQCQSSRANCERDEERDYSMCRSSAGSDEARRNACQKPNYDCGGHYNTCFEGCGGKIIPTQYCAAFCDQKTTDH